MVFLISLQYCHCRFIIGRVDAALVAEYASLASATIVVLISVIILNEFNCDFD